MRSRICLILFVFYTISCTNKNKVPDNIIQPDKMANLVWDVMNVEEYAREMIPADTVRNKHIKKERSILYQQLFDLHKTSREEFVKSFTYYSSRPDIIKTMFDTLAIRGNRMREESYKSGTP